MDKVVEFLNCFFSSEVDAIRASDFPDLDSFNEKLKIMNQFLKEDAKNKLGLIPMKELKSEDYYERVKNYPVPEPRFLFRIDAHNSDDHGQFFCCFVSDSNPDDWKSYLNLFIISKEHGAYKISSVFFFSNKGLGGEKKWHFNAGDKSFMKEINGNYLLNKELLDNRSEIKRLIEPSDDQDSIKEYNRE